MKVITRHAQCSFTFWFSKFFTILVFKMIKNVKMFHLDNLDVKLFAEGFKKLVQINQKLINSLCAIQD